MERRWMAADPPPPGLSSLETWQRGDGGSIGHIAIPFILKKVLVAVSIVRFGCDEER